MSNLKSHYGSLTASFYHSDLSDGQFYGPFFMAVEVTY